MPAVFEVQTDLGDNADANAYTDVAFFRQYHLDRGHDTTSLTDAVVQIGIVRATDYIDNRWRLRFAGTPLNEDQTTEFPRQDTVTDTGKDIVGLPVKLKMACSEYALRAAVDDLLIDAPKPIIDGEIQPSGAFKSNKVTIGPITEEKTYAEDAGGFGTGTILTPSNLLPSIPAADMLIEYLLKNQSRQREVIRA